MATLPEAGAADVLYLVDLSAYVFRAYHAIAPLSNSQGEPTHATYGTTVMLQRIVEGRQPSHFAVAMDSRTPTFRSELDARYKAHRPPPPPDLSLQMERCEEIVRAYSIPVFQEDGVEADDLIACAVARALQDGMRVVIASADKDLMQLVRDDDERVLLWDTMRDKVYGAAEVREKFGVPPSQLRDLLALMGDASDNVPGVPSVGPKTAADLLTQFGTLEGIYEHLEQIKRVKLREALQTHRDDALLSQKLVTLKCDLAIDWEPEALRYGDPDVEALKVLFSDLEFTRMLRALERGGEVAGGAPPQPGRRSSSKKSAAARPMEGEPEVEVLTDLSSLQRVLDAAIEAGSLALVVHADRPEPTWQEPIALSLSHQMERAYYLPLQHQGLAAGPQVAVQEAMDALRATLAHPALTLVADDVKSLEVLCGRELTRPYAVGCKILDVHVAAYLVDPAGANELGSLCERLLGVTLAELPSGPKKKTPTLPELEPSVAASLLAARAAWLLPLAERLHKELQEGELDKLAQELEFPLVHVLAGLEQEGVLVDVGALGRVGERAAEEIAKLEAQAHQLAGREFSLRSRDQLEAILFDELKLPAKKKTPKGGRSTDAAVLDELVDLHPIAQVILDYRELDKIKGTYVDALPRYVSPRTGRIHTRFLQTVAATGRLSSSDPNLQNIPIRTALGREIRKAFIAPEGGKIVSADYSQIELRVLAHLAGDATLAKAFHQGDDVHTYTAHLLFDVPQSEVTAEQRRKAKTINFGVLYGMGEARLARQLGIPRPEASDFIAAYFERYASVRAFLARTVDEAQRGEAVRTLLGRRRFLPNLRSPNRMLRMEAERIAKNTPIQGTAADILKLSMLALRTPVTPSTKMVLTVHDELVFEVADGEVDAARAAIEQTMSSVMQLSVPLAVSSGAGRSWDDAH